VIDVGVRAGQSPVAWIVVEVRRHVLMKLDLKINIEFSHSAYHNVGTYPAFQSHVAAGIVKLHVCRIVVKGLPDLGFGCGYKCERFRGCPMFESDADRRGRRRRIGGRSVHARPRTRAAEDRESHDHGHDDKCLTHF